MTNPSASQITSASEAATTGSRGTPLAPSLRYERGATIIKETDLTPRMRLMVQYMVFGPDHPSLADRIKRPHAIFDHETGLHIGTELRAIPIGEPCTLEEAAALCNKRRRWARNLAQQPAFQRLLAKQTQAFREGAKARAWRNIDQIAHDPGLGKAADRKVRLAASQALIGESEGARGTSISVTVNNQHVTPGYVIDLSPQAPTIEATALEHYEKESGNVER